MDITRPIGGTSKSRLQYHTRWHFKWLFYITKRIELLSTAPLIAGVDLQLYLRSSQVISFVCRPYLSSSRFSSSLRLVD